MELRVLRYFLTVAREENITAAAAVLHITQPTLSRQLQELESEVGASLLVRGARGKGVQLTDKGQLLRRRAEELVALADRTELEMASSEAEVSGEIAIGGGESEAMRLIARTVCRLRAQHPQLTFRLYSGNAEDVKEQLNKGLLDFGVFVEPTDLAKYEQLRLPWRDTWGVLLRRDHPLAQKNAIRPQDLPGVPLLMSRQRMADKPFTQWLGDIKIEQLQFVASYNLIYNAALMVEEGLGCALTLDKLTNTTGSALCFVPLAPRLEATLCLAWKKYQPAGRANELFLEEMRRSCEEAQA